MRKTRTLILFVEDDENFAAALSELLGGAGYDVVHFSEPRGAAEWLGWHKPDLVISDMRLPDISGVMFCGLVREAAERSTIPVLMLSAVREEADKVAAFTAGADDYVVKPFSTREFLFRVAALLRRASVQQGGSGWRLASGGLSVELVSGEVRMRGRRVGLRSKEYSLLSMFLKRKGQVLPYSVIREVVWGVDSVVVRSAIKVAISRLRKKLGSYGKRIKPIIGLGYRWSEKQ